MKPIKFKESNIVFGEDQPEYQPLPAHRCKDGQVISCWGLTLREKIKVLFTGKVYLSLHTFNQPIQPQLVSIDTLFIKSGKLAQLRQLLRAALNRKSGWLAQLKLRILKQSGSQVERKVGGHPNSNQKTSSTG